MSEMRETHLFKCDRSGCRREFGCVDGLRRHQAFHYVEEGSRVCSFCSKQFSTKSEVLRHLRAHSVSHRTASARAKNFQCELCKKKFFTRKDVKRHLVVHTGTRNFACNHCPQRFGRKDHLVRHVKKSHPAFALKSATNNRLESTSSTPFASSSTQEPLPGCSRDVRSSSHKKLSSISDSTVYDTKPSSSTDLFDLTDLTGLDDFKPPVVLPELRTILRPDGSSSSSSSGSGVTAACYSQDPHPTTACQFGESPVSSGTSLFTHDMPAERSEVDVNHEQPSMSSRKIPCPDTSLQPPDLHGSYDQSAVPSRGIFRLSRPDSSVQSAEPHESYGFR